MLFNRRIKGRRTDEFRLYFVSIFYANKEKCCFVQKRNADYLKVHVKKKLSYD